MSQYFVEEREGVLVFGETSRGRLMASLRRGAIAFFGASAVIGVVLIPDYFFRYKDTTPKAGLFLLSIALLAGVLAFAFGVARLAKSERWILDPAQKALVLERTVFGKPRDPEVLDLSYVSRWSISPGKLGGQSLMLWLQEGQEDPVPLKLIGGWGAGVSIKEIYSRLSAFCQKRKIRMSFD